MGHRWTSSGSWPPCRIVIQCCSSTAWKSLDPEKEIVAIKAVSINEGFFQGHFPGRPIMPGVLQVEALAQAAGVLAVESLGLAGSGKLVYFMSIDGVKFREARRAGFLLRLEVEFLQKRLAASASSRAGRFSTVKSLPSASSPR